MLGTGKPVLSGMIFGQTAHSLAETRHIPQSFPSCLLLPHILSLIPFVLYWRFDSVSLLNRGVGAFSGARWQKVVQKLGEASQSTPTLRFVLC